MMSRRAARLLCALGVALSFSTPRLSHAQDDATIEIARQRFREGVQFYDAHQYEKARLAFLQAYAIKPHPSVLLNLAQSELRSGHPDDAASHFSQYLRTNTSVTDAERTETTAGYATAKSRVGEVALSVDPTGAQVYVDGNEKGVAPLADPLYLLPGSHTIEARSGDRHASKAITLSAGQSVSVQLQARSAMAAAGAPGPAEAPATEPATEEPEGAAAAGPAEPAAEQPPSREPEEPPPAPAKETQNLVDWFANTPTAWVLAGVGVVGLGVGLTFALVSNHDYENANTLENQILAAWNDQHVVGKMLIVDKDQFKKDFKPCDLQPTDAPKIGGDRYNTYGQACAQYVSDRNAGDTARTVAIVSTAVGGAAIVGTVVYYFLDRHPAKAQTGGTSGTGFRARVAPWSGPTGAGVAIFGSF